MNMRKYYKRNIDNTLLAWSKESERKPLLLRGTRQVGKTTAVRHPERLLLISFLGRYGMTTL